MSQETDVGTLAKAQQAGTAGEPPAVARAEQLMTDWGHRLGLFVGTTRQRLQHTAQAMREEADKIDQPGKTAHTNGHASPSMQNQNGREPATNRAELLVDTLAQRVVAFTAAASLEVQRATAFVREDAEDIWAEAQSVHNQWRETSPAQNGQNQR